MKLNKYYCYLGEVQRLQHKGLICFQHGCCVIKFPFPSVQELKKHTSPARKDFQTVKQALETMKDVASLINERKRKVESINKIAKWQSTIEGWEVSWNYSLRRVGWDEWKHTACHMGGVELIPLKIAIFENLLYFITLSLFLYEGRERVREKLGANSLRRCSQDWKWKLARSRNVFVRSSTCVL